MPARILISDTQAAIIDGEWICPDRHYQKLLNAVAVAPSRAPNVPDPDLDAAQIAIDQLGAELIDTHPPPQNREGVVGLYG